MEYLRRVDFSQLASTKGRVTQSLIARDSGVTSCTINCIKTPPGEGSPVGAHTHPVDQIFYVLSGTMSLEIAGTGYEAGPGTLVIFPAGVPHRNWNRGNEATIHLAINGPVPEQGVPFTRAI
jgi:quercetin dioxygenase-like cupin family protein